MEITSLNPESFNSNETCYRKLLDDMKNWHEIPLLNHTPLHELRDLSLVRFRGMVQDMLDPELYLEKYEVRNETFGSSRIQNGRYRDCLHFGADETVDLESEKNVHGDRRTIFVISVPGINQWVSECEQNINDNLLEKRAKQLRMGQEEGGGGQKRSLDNQPESMEVDTVEISSNKRIRSEEKTVENESNKVLSSDYLLNSPLPDRPSKACMVKLYSNFENLPLNTMVDIVGFLSVDPALDGSNQPPDDFEEMSEIQAANPPPSLIPRLHAVVVKPLKHVNPFLDESLPLNDDVALENVEVVHKDLQIALTQCLFGDSVAANFLLSHLISNVFIRTDLQTLGQFSLNICGIPGNVLPEYTSLLYEIIEALLPASYYFPMTLENMNTQQFLPKKDYKTNKLVSGLLQLAPQTHLVLDETRLEPGKLEANGVRAVQSLAELIKSQQIKADFDFYEINFDMNIPVLTFSEGRSMMPSDYQIPLNPDPDCIPLITETIKAAKNYLQPKLMAIRKYLTSSKLLEFKMSKENAEMVEQDFVDIRKQDKSFGADELHSLLLLTRLLATARGKNVLDAEVWRLAKEMHNERQKRLDFLTKKIAG